MVGAIRRASQHELQGEFLDNQSYTEKPCLEKPKKGEKKERKRKKHTRVQGIWSASKLVLQVCLEEEIVEASGGGSGVVFVV